MEYIRERIGPELFENIERHMGSQAVTTFETRIESLKSFHTIDRVIEIAKKQMTYELAKAIAQKEKGKALQAVVCAHMKFGFHAGGSRRYKEWNPNDFKGYFEELWGEAMSVRYGSRFVLDKSQGFWMHSFGKNKLHLHVRSHGYFKFSFTKGQVKEVMEREWIKDKQGVKTLF